MERIILSDFQNQMKAQGQPSRDHIAFVCPVCSTVQSMASLKAVGLDPDAAERQVGFSCIGRHTSAGAFKKGDAPGKGCDWTLGGLFRIHEVEVELPDGKHSPTFRLASKEQADTLRTSTSAAA